MTAKQQSKAPRVILRPNVQKILAAIAYVISKAELAKQTVTQYDILKTLFLADKSHLNEYGRPITFDNYIAMKAGPVPSLAYDILKENKTQLAKFHIKKIPWIRTAKMNGIFLYSKASHMHFEEVLSDSDQKALSDSLNVIMSLTFGQIKRLTHADPAYMEAWEENEDKKAYSMSYGMLFDSPNYEQAETIEFLSKHT